MRKNIRVAGAALLLSVSFAAVAFSRVWAFLAAGLFLLFAAWFALPDSWRARILPAAWLPPAGIDAIQDVVERREWGRSRYRWTWEYIEAEGAIYLRGVPRDPEASMWLVVRDPTGIETHSGVFGAAFVVRYPQDFGHTRPQDRGQPPAERYNRAPTGRYRVDWGAIVAVGGKAVKRRIHRDRFRI